MPKAPAFLRPADPGHRPAALDDLGVEPGVDAVAVAAAAEGRAGPSASKQKISSLGRCDGSSVARARTIVPQGESTAVTVHGTPSIAAMSTARPK